ncbi:BgTH12-06911 [Blumeria graminis f. sp. triticale]|uniref:BgTH12-06911 n=1 Tax=Blumeria graminis f. sp. triticale TaxID=1689686 RepID=A0A9W4DQ85_BLUGR|nr:BgTH12-06911 [Blumeria graminis f. sp. triticale]
MPLSALMMTILEQAKEPLLCLHGAGYFTEVEWMQLDLIINKKYIWTTGPSTQIATPNSISYDVKRINKPQREARQHVPDFDGDKISSGPEETSVCTSVEPLSDEVVTPAASMDTPWELSPAMASPAPTTKQSITKLNGHTKATTEGVLASGYTVSQLLEARKLKASFANNSLRDPRLDHHQGNNSVLAKPSPIPNTLRNKNVSSWASQVSQGPLIRSAKRPDSRASEISELSGQYFKPPIYEPREIIQNSYAGDVNVFETSNAAEWDEDLPVPNGKPADKKIPVFAEEKLEKINPVPPQNLSIVPSQIKKDRGPHELPYPANVTIQGSKVTKKVNDILPVPPLPRIGIRQTTRTATASRSIRRKDPKEPKSSKEQYISPLPKTLTCWFWAESVGGCRYRPEECLNLHVKPEPGVLPNYPLKDGKPTWGSLADAVPQEVPAGKKPRCCWFWATKGSCDKGETCEYVHGWVTGGVAARPKNWECAKLFPRLAGEVEGDESSVSHIEEVLERAERDIGDKAPPQAVNIDPSYIASLIHAPDWFNSTC